MHIVCSDNTSGRIVSSFSTPSSTSEVIKYSLFAFDHPRNLAQIILRIFIKVGSVSFVLQLGHHGGLQLLVVDVLPVDPLEPLVPLDVLCPGLHVPQPLRPVDHQQLLDQVLSQVVYGLWPLDFTTKDLLINSKGVVVEKWGKTCKHLIDQY